jgi:DNA (cytosine-5)-methyltransferase 1
MIVDDAHQYLLDHFKEYDFIWASPPCPTHSRLNIPNQGIKKANYKLKYPDMKLYQEIILLKNWFDGLYCIENVISYYDPLIKPQIFGRHYYWANFYIRPLKEELGAEIRQDNSGKDRIDYLTKRHGFDLSGYDTPKYKKGKESILQNCVYPPHGKHILDCTRGNTVKPLTAFSKSLRTNPDPSVKTGADEPHRAKSGKKQGERKNEYETC